MITSTVASPLAETDDLPAALHAHANAGTGVLQPEFAIGQPGDAYEQEADHIADRIISTMPIGGLQRKCDNCAGETINCPKCREARQLIQSKASPGDARGTSTGPGPSIGGLQGVGQPLSPSTRAAFESRFQRDFTAVRVHTGNHAGESARSIHARAYTSGRDVVFGSGEFAPDNRAGQRLLAHELTHVIQQGHAPTLSDKGRPSGEKSNGAAPTDMPDRIARQADVSRPAISRLYAPEGIEVQRQDIFIDPRKTPPADPFAFPGVQPPDRLRFRDRIFMNDSLPTVCPRCHRETPTLPMPPRYLDKDATEPRLVMWATESETELHNDITARMIQLDPAAVDIIVDDYGVGLIKRITSTHEFEGSQKVRDEGAETIRRRWPDVRPSVRDRLVTWYQGELATAIGMTPKWASPVLRPERLKAVLASHEGKTAPLGRIGAVAAPGQRYGTFEIDDISDYTVYFHLPGRPLWRYEISRTDFIKHDPLVTEVYRQVAENTQWIRFILPFLLKAGAFALGFSGSVAVIITGIVLDELAEEMQRDAEGKPARSLQEILGSAGTQFLIDRIFHGLLGGSGKTAAHAVEMAPQLVGKVEKMADRAVPLIRGELAAAEKPLVKEALEHGTARRVTDDVLKAEGEILEVAIESGGQRHIFRMNKNGKWCRYSATICDLDLGADVATLANSPKSITAGRLEDVRGRIKDIEHEKSFLETIYARMRQGGKVDVSLLSKEERAFLDSLAEGGDAARLTLPELRRMALSPDLARHIKAAEGMEKQLVEQLYREGRPLYEIMRVASPSSKSRSFVLRAAAGRDAATGLAARSGVLEADHVVPLNDIVRMQGFDKLRPDRQLEIVNDVKNLRAIDSLANRSRGDWSWHEWPQALVHYDTAAISRMRALEDDLRTYIADRIRVLSHP